MENENQASVPIEPIKTKGSGGKLVLVIVIILIILAAGGVVVYGRYFSKPDSVLSTIVPKALNSNCKQNDPDLCKFLNNWANVGDMTMTMTSSYDGKANESIFKLDGKDRNEMVNKTDGKEDYHTISIGKTSYVFDYSDSKWWKYTPKESETSLTSDTEDLLDFDVEADPSTYKKIGKEACGKLTCFKYQVIDPSSTETTEYIYFDDKEYVLRKTRSESKDGSVSEAVTGYNNISVSEPSPVKEGNPYDLESIVTDSAASTSTPVISITEAQQQADALANEYGNQVTTDSTLSEVPAESDAAVEEVPSE